MENFLSTKELSKLGLAGCGENVLLDRSATIVNPGLLHVASNVRIDAYTIVTCGGECLIGDHVHISTHVFVGGRAGFELSSHSGLATGVRLLTTSDDFSGDYLTGPTYDSIDTNVKCIRTIIGAHAVAGANSVILPGADLGEGSILGALSLAATPLEAWTIYGGVPAKPIKQRSRVLLTRL